MPENVFHNGLDKLFALQAEEFTAGGMMFNDNSQFGNIVFIERPQTANDARFLVGRTLLTGPDLSEVWSQIIGAGHGINQLGFEYRPLPQNSNTTASWLLRSVGLPSPDRYVRNSDGSIVYLSLPDVDRTLERPQNIGVLEPQCFLAGTEITMWDGSKKPIEDITPNDWVLSHDKNGNPAPGRVSRTFTNEAKIILDFHGTFVTPGHVYFCAGGKYEGRFAPLIDILRDDGVVQHEDGTLIRAATGFAVGSDDDKEFWAFTAYEDRDGTERIREKKKLRLGTRWMLPNGHHFTMREYMAGVGIELLDDGYVRFKATGLKVPFIWTFSPALPNPEDFVLARSQATLDDIYRADQWEAMPPTMPVPLRRDSGPVVALSEHQLDAMPRNMPMAFDNESPSSELTWNRPRMNRKQRMAQEAKQRAADKARRKALH